MQKGEEKGENYNSALVHCKFIIGRDSATSHINNLLKRTDDYLLINYLIVRAGLTLSLNRFFSVILI